MTSENAPREWRPCAIRGEPLSTRGPTVASLFQQKHFLFHAGKNLSAKKISLRLHTFFV